MIIWWWCSKRHYGTLFYNQQFTDMVGTKKRLFNYQKGTYVHKQENVSSYIVLYSDIGAIFSKCITLHHLADLFIRTPTRFLWEVFSHCAKTTHSPIPTTVLHQVLVYTTEWIVGKRGVNDIARRGLLKQESNVLKIASLYPTVYYNVLTKGWFLAGNK